MTREDAELQAAKLAAESPDRATHRFLARQGAEGGWSVVKIGLPPVDETRIAEVRADEKPATPDDPRTAHDRNVGPWVGPG